MREPPLKAGDLVELRSPAEILSTLDEAGATDGLPFMPEMLVFFGASFRVESRVERACDVPHGGVRRLPNTVLLEDLRCSGKGHAGCQAGCRLYWKEAWLRPATGVHMPTTSDAKYGELETLVSQNVEAEGSTRGEPVYRCQATDWMDASEPISWWSARSFVREWTCGNVSLWQFSKIMARIVFGEIARRLHLATSDFVLHDPSVERVRPPAPVGIQPGTLVQIRSKDEIARTLDPGGRFKGLWFDREMVPYCGRTFPVQAKVERFIDEETGKLIELKSDCYILEGVACSGNLNGGKWFCRRAIYSWWREGWVEPVVDQDSTEGAGSEDHLTARPQS